MSEPDNKAITEDHPSPLDWVYSSQGKRWLWIFLYGSCGIFVLMELFYRYVAPGDEKGTFDMFPGAFAILGFVSCTIMIVGARLLGTFLKVKPDFYDDEEGGEDA